MARGQALPSRPHPLSDNLCLLNTQWHQPRTHTLPSFRVLRGPSGSAAGRVRRPQSSHCPPPALQSLRLT